jgi:hypothetical protein
VRDVNEKERTARDALERLEETIAARCVVRDVNE